MKMRPELSAMRARLKDPEGKPALALTDAEESAKLAMRHLIRAANQDRRLIEDRDWQELMTFTNEIIQRLESFRINPRAALNGHAAEKTSM